MGNNNFGEPIQNKELSSGPCKGDVKKIGKSKESKTPRKGMGVAALEKLRLEGEYDSSYVHFLQGLAFYASFTQKHIAGHHVFPSPQISTGPAYPRLGYFQRLLYYGVEEPELRNIRYGDPQYSAPSSWIIPVSGAMLGNQQFVQPKLTKNYIIQLAHREAPQKRIKLGGNAQTSETRDVEELDLTLKL